MHKLIPILIYAIALAGCTDDTIYITKKFTKTPDAWFIFSPILLVMLFSLLKSNPKKED
jgi:hypothetical protein